MAVSLPLILQLLQHQEPGFGLLCAFRLPLISAQGHLGESKATQQEFAHPQLPYETEKQWCCF